MILQGKFLNGTAPHFVFWEFFPRVMTTGELRRSRLAGNVRCVRLCRWTTGWMENNLELLNLFETFPSSLSLASTSSTFIDRFLFFSPHQNNTRRVNETLFVVTSSPLFTLSLNMGKTIVKVKHLLASMTFLCWSVNSSLNSSPFRASLPLVVCLVEINIFH